MCDYYRGFVVAQNASWNMEIGFSVYIVHDWPIVLYTAVRGEGISHRSKAVQGAERRTFIGIDERQIRKSADSRTWKEYHERCCLSRRRIELCR